MPKYLLLIIYITNSLNYNFPQILLEKLSILLILFINFNSLKMFNYMNEMNNP